MRCILLVLALTITATALEPYVSFDQSGLKKSSFLEQFDYPNVEESRWVRSLATKVNQGKTFKYEGLWAIEESSVNPAYSGDKGLVLKSRARHHAISRPLPEPFNNTNRDLVLQYEIKLQKELQCGGTYIKLLDSGSDLEKFDSETGYQIMFGPDRCGSDNKVHFIIKRPFNGTMEEKHLTTPPMSRGGDLTTLYTLIIRKNQDFEIRINGEVAKAGNLVTNTHLMEPPVNPPKEVVDWDATKPDDWDDRPFIVDPNAEKPADYDRLHGSQYIDDPNAVKPDDWDEEEPLVIEDPNATKPDHWDDEEDGKWIAPEIPNPKCAEHGCGPWSPPKIPNQDYVGPWLPPQVPNPNYKGDWFPPMKSNPNWFEDLRPSDLSSEIGALGFDLWSMENEVLFDNIYLGHYVLEAEKIGNTTWVPKYKLEKEYKETHKVPIKHEPEHPPPHFDDLMFGSDSDESIFRQFARFVRLVVKKHKLEAQDFFFDFFRDPTHTILKNPIRFAIYCVIFVTIFTLGFGSWAVAMFVFYNWKELSKFDEDEGELVVGPNKEVVRVHSEDNDDVEIPEPSEEKIVEIKDDTLRKRK